MIYFLIIFISVIFFILFTSIKICIYGSVIGRNVYCTVPNENKNDINLVIKIMGFIPVYKYSGKKKTSKKDKNILDILNAIKNSFKIKQGKKESLTRKIFKLGETVKFEKLILIGGFNTEDYVKNAYINASINSIICMYINKNQDNFNLNKLYYQVSISDYTYYLSVDTKLSFRIIKNIDILLTIFRLIKNLKKEKITEKQEDKYIVKLNKI